MTTVEKSIDVGLPVRVVYDQWTQFEDFPRFMEGIQEVRQLDDRRLHWVAYIGGQRKEWDANIIDQVPDERVAWQSIAGDENAGMVTFQKLADDMTRISLEMAYEAEGVVESAGSMMGFVTRRVEGDLERFKEFIEERGEETGAWRGTIKNQ